MKASQKWYRITCTVNKKTSTGYVISDYVKLASSYVNGTASSTVKLRKLPSDSSAYIKDSKNKVISAASKAGVSIISEATDKTGKKWFKVTYKKGSIKYTGYIPADQVVFAKTVAPTPTPTKKPTLTPTPTPTKNPTQTPTPTPTKKPTPTPTQTPTPTPTKKPTSTPTPTPTKAPTQTPTPTFKPTATPTPTPTTGTTAEGIVQFTGSVYVYNNITGSQDLLLTTAYTPVTLAMNEKVIILNSAVQNSVSWYYVSFTKGGKEGRGYVQAAYISKGTGGFVDNTPMDFLGTVTPTPTQGTAMSDADFENYMNAQGFPESYKSGLRQLHQLHPTWVFNAYRTGIDWQTAVTKESSLGVNLITKGKGVEWLSFGTGAYKWESDSFVAFDGSTWVTPSTDGLKYYMDPRNFLTEKGIFQFETLAFNGQYQNAAGVENILYNTPLYNTSYTFSDDNGTVMTKSYSETFMDAAQYSGVSPYHLASRSKQEVVTGTTSLSNSVSGKVSGYEGLYNFFNIGAYNSTSSGGAVLNGLKYAKSGTSSSLNSQYRIPWDSPYDAIVGGAYIIGSTYIKRGQDTLYLQKFNMSSTSTFSHQYMSNIEAPNAEAAKTYSAYSSMNSMPLVFSIPVYSNMPDSICSVPAKAYNPNNWLKSLAVNGYTLSPTFDLKTDQQYSLIVPNSVSSINVSAAAVSSKATVSGAGSIMLNEGANTVTVSVMAENGNVRNYVINVFREAMVTP